MFAKKSGVKIYCAYWRYCLLDSVLKSLKLLKLFKWYWNCLKGYVIYWKGLEKGGKLPGKCQEWAEMVIKATRW